MSDADELAAEVAAGRVLAIYHPVRGLRPMAHVFACDEGFVFADPGWDGLSAVRTQPFHAVAGQVRRSGAGWLAAAISTGGQIGCSNGQGSLSSRWRLVICCPGRGC